MSGIGVINAKNIPQTGQRAMKNRTACTPRITNSIVIFSIAGTPSTFVERI